jgi:hypothetical protein
MELTEEIKETVLKDHIYHLPPEKPDNTYKQQINNYNMVINMVNGMPFEEKMEHVLCYQKDNKLLDFEDGLETRFSHRIERLENGRYRSGYFLGLDDFLGLINEITLIDENHLYQFNVLFDRVLKRFRLYRCQEWESYLEDVGVKELVSLLKSYFLDTYEMYLVKSLHADSSLVTNRVKLQEHLDIYYRFLAIFDLSPSVQDNTDEDILGHKLVENNDSYLAEKYLGLYYAQRKELKLSEKSGVKRKIINIVKQNTIHNMSLLDKTLKDILKIDESFREQILQLSRPPDEAAKITA